MFYGQWNPSVDEVIWRNYFHEKNDGFFIECGAGDGVLENSCLFFEKIGWRGINIEPSDDCYKKLIINRPNCLNLNIGLGDLDRTAKFSKVTINQYIGGAVEPIQERKEECIKNGYTIQDIDINLLTYKTLMPKYEFIDVDLFVLDVEGYELKVINGMIGAISFPRVMCVEYPLIGLNPLKVLLKKLGYRFDFISFNNAYFSLPSVQAKQFWFGSNEGYSLEPNPIFY